MWCNESTVYRAAPRTSCNRHRICLRRQEIVVESSSRLSWLSTIWTVAGGETSELRLHENTEDMTVFLLECDCAAVVSTMVVTMQVASRQTDCANSRTRALVTSLRQSISRSPLITQLRLRSRHWAWSHSSSVRHESMLMTRNIAFDSLL